MKTFTDNYLPIEVELKNIKGEPFILKSQFMPADTIKEIEILGKDKKTLEMDKVYRILEIIFGKKENFWKNFSLSLLTKVSEYAIEESKKNSLKAGG